MTPVRCPVPKFWRSVPDAVPGAKVFQADARKISWGDFYEPLCRTSHDWMVRKRAIHSDHVPPANPLLNVGGLLYSLLMFGVVCGLLVVGLWQYRHSQEEAVVTKSNLPLASSNPPFDEVTWGTYRSQLYFGLRNRHPDSPLFGLIWYKQPTEQIVRSLSLRHWCEQGDNVQFMWEDSDGRSFDIRSLETEPQV
uniref:Mannosyl-oligosaccharide glucosidase n=1 Tax=Ditylenchus dipsaci TaxID=166011 RepID=A0A915DUU3_9BILA